MDLGFVTIRAVEARAEVEESHCRHQLLRRWTTVFRWQFPVCQWNCILLWSFSEKDTSHNSGERNNSSSLTLTETTAATAAVKLRNWQALWGIILKNENRKMTKNDYQSVCIVAGAFGRMRPFSWTASGQGVKNSGMHYTANNVTSPLRKYIDHSPETFGAKGEILYGKCGVTWSWGNICTKFFEINPQTQSKLLFQVSTEEQTWQRDLFSIKFAPRV